MNIELFYGYYSWRQPYLSEAFKTAINDNIDYVVDGEILWAAGSPIPNPNRPDLSEDYRIIDLSYLFDGMSGVENLDLSLFDITGVLYLNHMFRNCTNLEYVNLSSFMGSDCENTSYTFDGCRKLKEIDLRYLDTSNVIYFDNMLRNCNSVAKAYAKDVESVNKFNSFSTSKPSTFEFKIYVPPVVPSQISDDFRQAAFDQQTGESVIILLTFSFEGTDEKMRICDVPTEKFADLGENIYGTASNGERFLFVPFEFRLPQDDTTGAIIATLSVQNIDRSVIPTIRTARSDIKVNAQLVLSSNPDVVELEFLNFRITSVDYDAFMITGTLSFDFFDQEPFPAARFNPSNFPGLF